MKTHFDWPRERVKSIKHYPLGATTSYQLILDADGNVTSSDGHTVSRQILPPSIEQTMFDMAGNERASFHDCVNFKIHRGYSGHLEIPSWGLFFNEPYITWQNQGIVEGEISAFAHPLGQFIAPADPVCIPRRCSSLTSGENLSALVDQSDWVARMRSKERQIKISLNEGFDLVNFLIQWADVKRIISHYLTKKGWAERLHKFFDKSGNLTPGSIALKIANEHLEHQYGTLQTVRDIKQLFSILTEWKEKSDKLLARADEDLRFYQETIIDDIPGHVETWSFPVSGRVNSYIRSTTSYPDGLQLRACMAYHYAVPAMSGLLGRIKQLSDSLGLSLDPAIVWNAIPWTFVLDWFLNISEMLHNERIDWVTCQVTVDDYCRSAKVRSDRVIEWISSDPSDPGVQQITHLMNVVSHYYKRERDCPFLDLGNVDLPPTHWSYTRVCNASALLVQQVPRPFKFLDRNWAQARSIERDARMAADQAKRKLSNELKAFKRTLKRVRNKAQRYARLAKWKVEKFNKTMKWLNMQEIVLRKDGPQFLASNPFRFKRSNLYMNCTNIAFEPSSKRFQRAIARMPHIGLR